MNIDALLSSFATRRILVIGDSIVDIETHLGRIKDDDTGKPTYRTILDHRGKSEAYSIGGAGLVVRNLLELGAKVDWITATGYGIGALAVETFFLPNLTKRFIKVGKPQTVKHRFWCGGEKILQVDTVDNKECGGENVFYTYIAGGLDADAIVVADYRHGMISEGMAKQIVRTAYHAKKNLYVASQVAQSGSNHHWYGKPAVLVMNDREACLAEAECLQQVVYTNGDKPSVTIMSPIEVRYAPTIKVDVVDSCGAGDAFLAAYALTNNLKFANIWAGLSCTVQGANPPTQQMLLDWYEKREASLETAFCG